VTKELRAVILGTPVPKLRPRVTKKGHIYNPDKSVHYENIVADTVAEASNTFGPGTPLYLSLRFVLPKPKSARKWEVHHAKRPDLSNFVKAVEDGLKRAGIYHNDAQISEIHASKRYGEHPRCEILVRELV